jgi:hypothetical protein
MSRGGGTLRLLSVLARLALLAVLLFTFTGCADGGTVLDVTAWTFHPPEGAPPRPITLPAHVNDALPDRLATYALRTHVTLPPELRGRALALTIRVLPAHADLRVNGREVAATLHAVTDTYRGTSHLWRITPDLTGSGELDLEIEVQHTWTQSSWLDSIPRLSATEGGDRAFVVVRGVNEATGITGVVSLVMIGFTYGLIFFMARGRPANGWFALEAFTGAVYPAFQLGILQSVFGTSELALLATFFCVSAVATVYFSHAKFGLGPPSRWWGFSLLVCVVLAGTRGDPFSVGRWLVPWVAAVSVANAIYQVVLVRRIARRGPLPVNVVVITLAWPVAVTLAIPDIVGWLGFGLPLGGLNIGSFSTALVAMLQSAALSREHFLSLNEADRLNAELAQRVAMLETRNNDVQVLNEELGRQVAARSEQLADLLARLNVGDPENAELRAGDLIKGHYRVKSPLGTGGSGKVYQVERVADGSLLALKVLTGVSDSGSLARFAREAHLVSQVRHENVVRLVDIDVTSEGMLFIVMELVNGPSLRNSREHYGRVDWAVPVIRQIAAGLAAIHAEGIIHRDLKPANVLLAPSDGGDSPVVKIADFGISTLIARATSDAPPSDAAPEPSDDGSITGPQLSTPSPVLDSGLTQTGMVLGTPLYMAPEMLAGARSAKAASDVFSLGVIAFELLAGVRPFGDLPTCAVIAGRDGTPVPSLRDRAPEVAAHIVEIVDRCLMRSPSKRPTASELASQLSDR